MIGFAVILCMPKGTENLMKWMAVAATTPPLLLAIWLYANFDRTVGGVSVRREGQLDSGREHRVPHGRRRGISITMVLLTALLSFICIFGLVGIDKGVKGYFSLFLLLDTGMMGVFCALDFFLFFVLLGGHAAADVLPHRRVGRPARVYAAIKFFLYTLVGSALMLIVMLAMYYAVEPHTFDMTKLIAANASYGHTFQRLAWLGLFIGFAIKIPAFPFHHLAARRRTSRRRPRSRDPRGRAVEDGTYGILRFNYAMFPASNRRAGLRLPRHPGHVEHRFMGRSAPWRRRI